MKNESREAGIAEALEWFESRRGSGWHYIDKGIVLAAEVRRLEAMATGLALALENTHEALGLNEVYQEDAMVEAGVLLASEPVVALLSKAAKSQEGKP